jgi:hypothetical protein
VVISHGFKKEKYVSNFCIARERRNKVNGKKKTFFIQNWGTIKEIHVSERKGHRNSDNTETNTERM